MNVPLAWTVLTVSAVLVLCASFPLRTRIPPLALDGLLGLGGAGAAVGGLLFLQDVGLASWIVAPLALAVAAIAHVRALFAGAGPFRT
jgi:hypothetical protein